MDDIINMGIMYGTHPPKGIYFTVSVEYNVAHPIFQDKLDTLTGLTSTPIRSFPDAMEASEIIAKKLQLDDFEGSEIMEVDPAEHHGYHFVINDTTKSPIAMVGVITHDHRNVTLH